MAFFIREDMGVSSRMFFVYGGLLFMVILFLMFVNQFNKSLFVFSLG